MNTTDDKWDALDYWLLARLPRQAVALIYAVSFIAGLVTVLIIGIWLFTQECAYIVVGIGAVGWVVYITYKAILKELPAREKKQDD